MQSIADFTRQTVEQIVNLEPGDLRPERAELGPCPRCGAQTGSIIRENSKAYGCTSWKNKDEPGCGFVIWKKLAGRTLSPQIARELLEHGHTSEVLAGFRSKAGKTFRARLLLDSDGQIAFDMPSRLGGEQTNRTNKEDSALRASHETSHGGLTMSRPLVPEGAIEAESGRARKTGGPKTEQRTAREVKASTFDGEGYKTVSVPPTSLPSDPDFDIAAYLKQAGLDVIDKRPSGSLWVVDGDPPSPALSMLLDRGIGFAFTPNGSRATHRRPGWYIKGSDQSVVKR